MHKKLQFAQKTQLINNLFQNSTQDYRQTSGNFNDKTLIDVNPESLIIKYN